MAKPSFPTRGSVGQRGVLWQIIPFTPLYLVKLPPVHPYGIYPYCAADTASPRYPESKR
jgi:hypothetical protein